jgi:adenylate cyclase
MTMSARLHLTAIAIGLGCGLIAALLCHPSARIGLLGQALWRAEWISYDYRLSYGPNPGASPDIVLVTIDQESFAQPQMTVWPWPRRFHAWTVARLKKAGARYIGLDMVLEGSSAQPGTVAKAPAAGAPVGPPPPGPDDLKLAQTLKRDGNVLLAMEVAREKTTGAQSEMVIASFPHPDLEDAALGVACVNLPRDLDGIIRRYWASYTHQGEVIPTLAFYLASLYRNEDLAALTRRIMARGRSDYPLLGGQSFFIHYRAPIGVGFTRIPYYRVMTGDFDPALVRGKIVLVGATASLLQDLHGTPMALRGLGGAGGSAALMPGVEILASATDTVLRGNPIRPLAPLQTILLTLLVSLIVALLLFWLRPVRALFMVWLPLTILLVVATFEVFWLRDLWVPLVPLLLGATLTYGLGTVYLELTVEREQARLRRAWGKRVSPEVLSVILSDSRLAQVAGRRVTGTVFFSDLQGFTTFCHDCPPETVVTQINAYLQLATQVIRRHGGTLHKFIGDGVMAVFGDPVPQEDHARRAVAASLELQREMARLRDQQPADAWPMLMRIGLHSGELIAGDIGSEDLLEYTVMGDTVSTASRLESLNKDYGTWIMLSGATAAQVADHFRLVPLGEVQVRGRSEALEIYTVTEAQGAQ